MACLVLSSAQYACAYVNHRDDVTPLSCLVALYAKATWPHNLNHCLHVGSIEYSHEVHLCDLCMIPSLADACFSARPDHASIGCSVFITGGDEVSLVLKQHGHTVREIHGSACSDTRQDTYSLSIFVDRDAAPGRT